MFEKKKNELLNECVNENPNNRKFINMIEIEMIYSDYRSAIMLICKCKEERIPIVASPFKENVKHMSNPHIVEEHTEEQKNLIKQLTKELERIAVTMES